MRKANPSTAPAYLNFTDRILVTNLSAVEKILLIALSRRPPGADVTAATLARLASVHRVTAQKTLAELYDRGVIHKIAPQRWRIDWQAVEACWRIASRPTAKV